MLIFTRPKDGAIRQENKTELRKRKVILLFLCLATLCVSCHERTSWPPETSGPNLPVRYCDIQKGDKDTCAIGYVFVDSSAVNWMLPNLLPGSSVYTPTISDLRKAERILESLFPSILEMRADKDGRLFKEGGLRNYARQYVFLKSAEDRKYVYINFVFLEIADLEDKAPAADDMIPPSWRYPLSRSLQFVMDGGDAFWQAMLDLDNDDVMWFSVNGLA